MRFQLRASLRNKTLLIVLAALVGLVGGLYLLSRVVLLRGFSGLEASFAGQNLDRASSALSNEIDTLRQAADQYADQDRMYGYLREKNLEGVTAEFPARIFEQLRVNYVVVLDANGRKAFSKGFNLVAMEARAVPEDLDSHFQAGSLLLGHPEDTVDTAGIVMLASGPVLLDSSPILTSNSEGPAAGRLIMVRALDADETVRLAGMTHMPVEIERIDAGEPQPDFATAASAITNENPVLIRAYSPDSLAAYQALHDIYGKPVAILRVLLPRKIYEQGQTSLLQFLLLLLAAGLLFGAITMSLLETIRDFASGRPEQRHHRIGASGDLGARFMFRQRRTRQSGRHDQQHA